MIDAGSTGSRVFAFSFHESILGGNLVLDDEHFLEIKPGLSAYADKSKDGAKSLTVLLDKVKNVIPRSEWQHTPLSMRATAGLRLLPSHKAQDILQECRKLFEDSNFQVCRYCTHEVTRLTFRSLLLKLLWNFEQKALLSFIHFRHLKIQFQ